MPSRITPKTANTANHAASLRLNAQSWCALLRGDWFRDGRDVAHGDSTCCSRAFRRRTSNVTSRRSAVSKHATTASERTSTECALSRVSTALVPATRCMTRNVAREASRGFMLTSAVDVRTFRSVRKRQQETYRVTTRRPCDLHKPAPVCGPGPRSGRASRPQTERPVIAPRAPPEVTPSASVLNGPTRASSQARGLHS
jgi:hypothetical protein